MFAKTSFFAQVVARLQWDAAVIDLTPDARAWPELPVERRRRLTTLLAGFCIAEQAVAEQLAPFGPASGDTMFAWTFFLQRRDEARHAQLFDRIAAEVLGVARGLIAARADGESDDQPVVELAGLSSGRPKGLARHQPRAIASEPATRR